MLICFIIMGSPDSKVTPKMCRKKLSTVHGLTVLNVKGAVKDGACWNVMPKLFKFFGGRTCTFFSSVTKTSDCPIIIDDFQKC